MYDVIIVGGGPAGLSIGSELSKTHKVLIIEKGTLGNTYRSWFVPGEIVARLDNDVQPFFYNGIKKMFESTPNISIGWESVAPWKSEEKWKTYPFVHQNKLLNFWLKRVRDNKSDAIENSSFIDYKKYDDHVDVRVINTDEPFNETSYQGRLLIDASGFNSSIASMNRIKRTDYVWWSIYGWELTYDDFSKLKNPDELGNVLTGDFMLWQSFKDTPQNSKATLSDLRPVFEYEVLDENTIFIFLLYFNKDQVDKEFMKNQFTHMMLHSEEMEGFREGELTTERFGWYPSCGISQSIAKDRVAFVGDSGCWTVPDGYGMSFILNNYKHYSEHICDALEKDNLSAKRLNKATQFNMRQKYLIKMDQLVLNFMSYAEPKLLDKFTMSMFKYSRGVMIEKLFILQTSEKDSLLTLLRVIKHINPFEILKVIKNGMRVTLLFSVGLAFFVSSITQLFRIITFRKAEPMGYRFKKIKK